MGRLGSAAQATVWKPVTNQFRASRLSRAFAGALDAADGRILVSGGHAGGEVGIVDAIIRPRQQRLTTEPNMSTQRWYPSSTTLGMVACSG